MIGKLTVALAAVALVSQAVLAQDTTTAAPKGPPPRLITVRSVDGAKGEVIFDVQVVSPDHRDKFVRQPLIGDKFIGEPLTGDKFIGEPLIGDKFIGAGIGANDWRAIRVKSPSCGHVVPSGITWPAACR